MLIGEIYKLDAESETFENIRDASAELHRATIRGGDVKRHVFTDGNLRDGVDVAPSGADIADPRGPLAGCKLELDFFQVGVSIFFSWHRDLGYRGRCDTG